MSAWPETALGEVLADATPGFACGEDVADGVFQFRMNNITTAGQLDLSKRRRVPKDYRNIDRFIVQTGDVLFNATNSPDLVGKTAFFPGLEETAVFSNHFLRLRPRDGEIDGRYLARWLNLQFLHGRFKGMCRQWVNQATVGRDALLSLRLPLPPLPEQRRIAEILDKADALRAKRRTALAKLDTLTQSIFLDSFIGTDALATQPLESVCELITDGTHYTPTYSENGTIFLSSKNVKSGFIDWDDVKYIPEELHLQLHRRVAPRVNDILLAKNGTTGVAAIVDRDCVFDIYVSLALLRPSRKVLPVYLREAINSPACKRQFDSSLRGIGVPNLHLTEIKRTRIPVPPIELQREFVRKVETIQKQRSALYAALGNLDRLSASLQQRAFRGELIS